MTSEQLEAPTGYLIECMSICAMSSCVQKLKVNEIRNGRLVKTTFLGFIWQAYITREGPWKNLQDHLADPYNNNICLLYTSPSPRD